MLLEKKEIAMIKCKAVSIISNQLQTAFIVLGVQNGRELAIKLAERLSGIHLTFDFSPAMCCNLLLFDDSYNE